MEAVVSPGNTLWQAGSLSAVAGYADTVGFLNFHAFAGLVTGNSVLLGIAVAAADWIAALRSLTIIVAFLVGIAVAVALHRLGVVLMAFLAFEAALIGVAAFSLFVYAAPVLAFAMGLQNAAAHRFAGTTLNTVFLSGDLQKLVAEIVGTIAGLPGRAKAESGSGVLMVVYACYLDGALFGGLLHALTRRPLLFSLVGLGSALLGDRASARRTLRS